MFENLELWVITGFHFWTFLNQFSFGSYKVLKELIYRFKEIDYLQKTGKTHVMLDDEDDE